MKTTATVPSLILVAFAALATACGGGDNGNGGGTGGSAGGGATGGNGGGGTGGSSSFTPATPPSDVCAMLTLADVQAQFPTAQAGVEQQSPDTSAQGFWSRDCKYEIGTGGNSIELVVFGATTSSGLAGIKLAAQSGDVNNPVSGVGDEAHYWQDTSVGTSGLWALKAPYSVDVTAYFIKPFPTADQFKPLVVKALGQLQ